jgi:hypothetical protein
MARKSVLMAMTVALPIAFLTTVGSGVAWAPTPPPPPVTFVGNISCNLQGTITITPAANNVNFGTYVVKFTGTNNHCVGLPTSSTGTTVTPLTQGGEHLKKSTDTFTFTFPQTSTTGGLLCTTLEHGGPIPTPISTTINWLGTSPITSTGVMFPNGGTIVPGVIELLNGGNAPGSSFAGTTDILLGYNLASVFAACATTAGLSTFPVNHLGGDNLMAGPAF